ncbi:MAG: hypothetical protein QM530_01130 [Phycisphaerales bacterium]|nr:hypothetical protein [Phycisphaerales bacterium]
MAVIDFKYHKEATTILFIVSVYSLATFLTKNLFSLSGVAISAFALTGAIIVIINEYLWNYFPFTFLFKIKCFAGEYEGEIRYSFLNENFETISGNLKQKRTIKQTGSSIFITTETFNPDGSVSSKSESKVEQIVVERDGTFKLFYTYFNEGNFEQKLMPHYGTEVLHIKINKKNCTIEGEYYTNRQPNQTRGKISLTKIK